MRKLMIAILAVMLSAPLSALVAAETSAPYVFTDGAARLATPGIEGAVAMGLIVKRLREKMPATKLLLLGIFPRGFEADDTLRAANAKANMEFRQLADGKFVHTHPN